MSPSFKVTNVPIMKYEKHKRNRKTHETLRKCSALALLRLFRANQIIFSVYDYIVSIDLTELIKIYQKLSTVL